MNKKQDIYQNICEVLTIMLWMCGIDTDPQNLCWSLRNPGISPEMQSVVFNQVFSFFFFILPPHPSLLLSLSSSSFSTLSLPSSQLGFYKSVWSYVNASTCRHILLLYGILIVFFLLLACQYL